MNYWRLLVYINSCIVPFCKSKKQFSSKCQYVSTRLNGVTLSSIQLTVGSSKTSITFYLTALCPFCPVMKIQALVQTIWYISTRLHGVTSLFYTEDGGSRFIINVSYQFISQQPDIGSSVMLSVPQHFMHTRVNIKINSRNKIHSFLKRLSGPFVSIFRG